MRTQRLATLDLDPSRLAADLEGIPDLPLAETYLEYNCGRPWKACMLWAPGGDAGDGILQRYDTSQPCRPTEHGRLMPYIRDLVEQCFGVEHLLFARLVVLTSNVLIPHRDYMEFEGRPAPERAAHRLHVPLVTSEDCYFMEDNVVYRMRPGEVWFVDVTRTHSAAVLSELERMHLILDFAAHDDSRDLLKVDFDEDQGIPSDARVDRPPLSSTAREALLSLSGLVDEENLWETFGILIKKQYRYDCDDNFVWDMMREIVRRSGRARLSAQIDDFYRHCVGASF